MRFVLDREVVDVDLSSLDGGPATTLLEALRLGLGRTGTKEGCASGDCGACTVLTSRAPLGAEGDEVYESVNACIAPAAAFAGHHVVTVEGLRDPASPDGEGLHPAQRAMVECHGSQCGFCTPGFVMSLAGLHEARRDAIDAPSREDVLEAIAGNLCRCTGYRPIVDAASRMFEFDAPSLASLRPVDAMAGSAPADGAGVAFHRPRSEAELQELLAAHPSPRLIAGGTDLMLEYTQNHAVIEALVDVSGIETLHGIERDGEALRIGAATPLRTLEHDLAETLPALTELLTRYGSAQIRHRATLGGSLGTASPIGDLSPVLQVLDAELELVDARGERRRVSVDDFHLDYRRTRLADDEYIAAAHLRLPSPDARLVVHKFSKRMEDDISTVLGAALVSASEVRIAWGGMAATPRRSRALEQVLATGTTPDDAAIDAAIATDTTPMDDVRGSARYRAAMARAFVHEALDVRRELGRA